MDPGLGYFHIQILHQALDDAILFFRWSHCNGYNVSGITIHSIREAVHDVLQQHDNNRAENSQIIHPGTDAHSNGCGSPDSSCSCQSLDGVSGLKDHAGSQEADSGYELSGYSGRICIVDAPLIFGGCNDICKSVLG